MHSAAHFGTACVIFLLSSAADATMWIPCPCVPATQHCKMRDRAALTVIASLTQVSCQCARRTFIGFENERAVLERRRRDGVPWKHPRLRPEGRILQPNPG